MKKIVVVTIAMFFILGLGKSWGQQQAQSSLYHFNPLTYNPAYAGSRDALSITAAHRIQWVGINGAPQTTYLSAHGPIGSSQLSVGGDITYDQIGISKTTSAYADVSYYVQVNENGHRLSFGIKGGINLFDAPLRMLHATDKDDPMQIDINNKIRGNFGAGVYYYGPSHFFGVSSLTMLEASIFDKDQINALEQVRHYYLTAGFVFDISSTMKMRPTALVKVVKGAPIELDAEVGLLLYERIWFGVGYRHEESVRGYILANITPQLRIGYNYDYIFNDLTKYTGGTHEFMLSYEFNFDEMKFKSPRYF